MKHAYTWGAILAVVLASTTGDVLLSRAMKKVSFPVSFSLHPRLAATLPAFLFHP